MSSKYKRISCNDVLSTLISTSVDFLNPIGGVINLVNIADLLKTSRYQVKKHMDSLVGAGVAEYKVVQIPSEEDIYPPYCGYCLSRMVKDGNEIPEGLDRVYILHCKSLYQRRKAEHDKWIDEWVNDIQSKAE